MENFLNKITQGDCLEKMKLLPDNCVDAIVTDPPYGLNFMGKKWDCQVPYIEIWQECIRVLRPGGYLLAFAGTRTQHRMACNIEDAGFEIRDMIAWVYGSGFPKSLDIGKAVDKLQGSERENIGVIKHPTLKDTSKIEEQANASHGNNKWKRELDLTKGNSDFEGWGTALKPALEPITVARKPLSEKTVAKNCLKWGTGGINIDGCRVDTFQEGELQKLKKRADLPRQNFTGGRLHSGAEYTPQIIESGMSKKGRFPANLIHDGSEEVLALFPNTKSGKMSAYNTRHTDGSPNGIYGRFDVDYPLGETIGDSGSAARFFYCAKTSQQERNAGCNNSEINFDSSRPWRTEESDRNRIATRLVSKMGGNNHPTVKPIELMQYLIKLVSREESIILDPFMGSGTTAIAARKLNRNYIGFELDEKYIKIAEKRFNQELGMFK